MMNNGTNSKNSDSERDLKKKRPISIFLVPILFASWEPVSYTPKKPRTEHRPAISSSRFSSDQHLSASHSRLDAILDLVSMSVKASSGLIPDAKLEDGDLGRSHGRQKLEQPLSRSRSPDESSTSGSSISADHKPRADGKHRSNSRQAEDARAQDDQDDAKEKPSQRPAYAPQASQARQRQAHKHPSHIQRQDFISKDKDRGSAQPREEDPMIEEDTAGNIPLPDTLANKRVTIVGLMGSWGGKPALLANCKRILLPLQASIPDLPSVLCSHGEQAVPSSQEETNLFHTEHAWYRNGLELWHDAEHDIIYLHALPLPEVSADARLPERYASSRAECFHA
jgi:hypothetical protein